MPVISTNTAANTAVRFLNRNSTEQSSSLAKLASGSNINKASDDAAGLAISTKIGTDVAALEQASTNASHGISVLQTADGGASNIADIVERMKTLASQSASGTVTDKERTYIQAEFSQLKDEVDGITESTRYNGQSLLDGSSDFSVDDTKTAAVANAGSNASVTGGVMGTTGTYTNSTGSAQTATLDINGTTVSFGSVGASGGTLTAAQVATAINDAKIEGVTASASAGGALTITSTVNDLEIANGTGSDAAITAATFGLTAATTNIAATATASYTNSGTEDQSGTIMIDGTKVEITAEAGATITAQDMATQINTALKESGNYTVSASVNSTTNQLELTSITKGENATVTLADFDTEGGLSLATLGLTAGTTHGTTTEVSTTGADIVVGSTSADTINLSIEGLTAKDLGIADLDVSTKDGADKALSVLDTAIDTISNARAEMGATMSRFEFRSAQIDTSVENLEAAKSAIADVDIAKEQASLSSSTVKVQAAVAAASQANQMPQNLLSLIR
ncbi:flagellin [Cohaesibacter haloalkalitolerans]|uniref:flagellin N-terminal helical domain-containing protein n=1 Tax=Cohaesibacter haloalkalitolerans TaxID=1162980 RepID=UPI000E64A638|nr:flagellin [Cohaesibacter haloalkalitolerans]